MNCDYYQKQLIEYIDSNLSEDQVKNLKNHLKTCKNCKKEFQELKVILDNFQHIPEIKPDKSLDNIDQNT